MTLSDQQHGSFYIHPVSDVDYSLWQVLQVGSVGHKETETLHVEDTLMTFNAEAVQTQGTKSATSFFITTTMKQRDKDRETVSS